MKSILCPTSCDDVTGKRNNVTLDAYKSLIELFKPLILLTNVHIADLNYSERFP